MTTALQPTPLATRSRGRLFFWLGIALCLAAPIIYIVQVQVLKQLFVPWYAAVLLTVGVALLLYAVTRRAGVIRIIFLGLFALLCAFEWLFLVVLTKLPAYEGPLKDEMVLGENDRGFATRGSLLVAFDVREGTESWRHDTHVRGIEVFAALADGGCLVQTPDAVVNVHDAEHAAELMKGKVMMGWNGQMYVKHR